MKDIKGNYFRETKNLKWVTWHDHAPFKNSLLSVGWELLWPTCTPKLEVSMFTHYGDMKGNEKCRILDSLGVMDYPKVNIR